jgi:hypothetical protein
MTRPPTLPLALLALSACVPAYRAPGPGEPAALVKVRLAYDHTRALALVPPEGHDRGASVTVRALEDEHTYAVAERALPDLLDSPAPAPLETLPVFVHAGRPVVLEVSFSIGWSTTSPEWVTKTEQVTRHVTRRVPRTVTRTESHYDPITRSVQHRTVHDTEYVTETQVEHVTEERRVLEPVTRPHRVGCVARVSLRPERGAVYLVDYTNLAVAENCAATAFVQAAQPDGTFTLTPAAPAPPADR